MGLCVRQTFTFLNLRFPAWHCNKSSTCANTRVARTKPGVNRGERKESAQSEARRRPCAPVINAAAHTPPKILCFWLQPPGVCRKSMCLRVLIDDDQGLTNVRPGQTSTRRECVWKTMDGLQYIYTRSESHEIFVQNAMGNMYGRLPSVLAPSSSSSQVHTLAINGGHQPSSSRCRSFRTRTRH